MRIRERNLDGTLCLYTIDSILRIYAEKIKLEEMVLEEVPEELRQAVENLIQ